ncbi:MAG TPA: hypothetical protein VMV94_01740 [Phycisphaerae bacterium]|nr:hypothetical protein [Phycisphaerae bacterium]
MTPSALILAQAAPRKGLQSLFENLQSAMHPNQVGPPAVMLVLGFVAGIIALLLVLAIIKSRRQTQDSVSRTSRPMRLFSKALKNMGISFPDRVLMRIVARRARVAQPAIMLFSPDLLERYSAVWIDSLGFRPLRARIRARLKAVAAKAFE